MTGQLGPDATSPNSRILCKNYIYETGVVGLMVLASKALVYTGRLLGADRPQAPVHRDGAASDAQAAGGVC